MRTKEVRIGKVKIGGDNPIAVQSMTSTLTHDVKSTVGQIERLVNAGCEIVRVAIPTWKDLRAFKEIRKILPDVPLVADIHFNHKLAIAAIESGADKIRINPGNIGGRERVNEIIKVAKEHNVPIRIGVNSGSLELDLIDKHGGVTAEAMVESALKWVKYFEDQDFTDIVISVKSASVPMTIKAYRELSRKTHYPLHLGVTEAGPQYMGIIKSAIGIGTLLADGIGDTIRVSLTADPVEEVRAAWEILKALEIRARGPMLISCPTCGRTRVNLLKIVGEVEKLLQDVKLPIKVAVMGCEVNGPGEAKDADIGVAAEPGRGVIFRKGKIIRKVKEEEIPQALLEEIKKFSEDQS